MTRETKKISGFILITVPSIIYGGYFLLTILSGQQEYLALTQLCKVQPDSGFAIRAYNKHQIQYKLNLSVFEMPILCLLNFMGTDYKSAYRNVVHFSLFFERLLTLVFMTFQFSPLQYPR